MKPPLRRALLVAVIVVLVAVTLVLARHAIAGFAIARALAVATGDRVTFGRFTLGRTQIDVRGLHVSTAGGDPLIDAEHLDIRYSLRDLIAGGGHRFGLTALTVDAPTFTLVRHSDGTYNLRAAGSAGGAGPSGAAAPLAFRVRIRDGTVRLIDRSPVAPDLADQRITGVSIEAQIASDRQSRARGRAIVRGRRTADAALTAWPITLNAISDVPRGMASVQVRAKVLPLRGALGFVQHSSAVRVDDGLLHDLTLRLFTLNIGLTVPAVFEAGGSADVDSGRLTFSALRRPVRGLHGRLLLTDDGVWTTGLRGTLGGIPLRARGGAFDRLAPVLRLGIAADGDLAGLRALFAFSRQAPVAGAAHVRTLIEAPVANLLIRSAVSLPRGRYGAIPLTDVGGRVDYHASTVLLDGVHARYGAAALHLGGRFLLGGPTLDSTLAVAAGGPGRALPYAENLAPEARIDTLAVISGRNGFGVRGAIGVAGRGIAGRAMFVVDRSGVGEFGPFVFERSDGSSLVGALRLERPTSQSAAWISASNYRVAVPKNPGRLLGLSLPAFPPVAGIIDAALAGGGSPGAFAVAGSLRGHSLRVANAELGSGHAQLAGTLGDVRLSDVALDGPLGRFRGDAAVAGGTFTLRGDYDGSLERLVPLTGKQLAHGSLHGAVSATLGAGDIVVQSAGATLRGASIRGVAIDRAAGTLAVRGSAFHLVVADGSIGGRRAVARESGGAVAISAPDLPTRALRGTGVPLEAGNVSVYGVADLRGHAPAFDGTVAVAGGRSRGYRVAGDAQIDLMGSRARIDAATGALGATYGSIGGSIDGIGEHTLRYNLDTRVPLGDIALLRRDLALPVRHLEGSFSAQLHVRGTGARPVVDGRIFAPEGVYNGLAFRDAAGRLILDADGVAARDARLTIGSTQAAIAARTGGGTIAFAARSERADLADLNDFFDAGDTLAGRGRFDLAFQWDHGRIDTRGALDLRDLHYRRFALGDAAASWHMARSAISGQAQIASAAGTAAVAGRIAPATGAADLIGAFRNARYDLSASVKQIDLGTWLPAAGVSQSVLGTVDGRLRATGRLPGLALAVDATLGEARVAGFPIRNAQLHATSLGTRIHVTASSADLGFATFSGTGTLGLEPNDPLAFDLRTTTNDVGPAIRTFVPAAHGINVAGALDADVRVAGTRQRPTVEGGFDLTDARYGNFAVPRAIGALALAGRAIELRDADVEFSRGQAFIAGSLPLQLQPFGLGPPRASVSFDVTARSVDLAQFAPLLPAGTTLGGTVDGRFGVEGTVDRPRMLGSLAIADGSYLSRLERAPIQHFNARVAFAGSSVALETFHAGVGSGTLDAGGRISLPLGTNAQTSYALDVRAKAAQLDFPAYGRGTLDGALRLTGGSGRPLLSGEVTLRDAVIPVSAVYGSGGASGTTAATGAFVLDPDFAIRASVANDVRVRSSIVDVGVTGTVDLTGSLRAPKLAGAFVATDGTVSSYNHVFRVVNAAATFDPADGILPTIDARATARVNNPDPDPSRNIAGSANITVSVNGTPDSNNLQVAYSSDPAYSQEQIVGLLLDVPALLGALNFNLNGGAGATLRGAPGETNALLPPGVTPEQVSAISFNQEVFSLLNGQFTQRALNPVERVFEKVFGLSDVEFTVDYGGGIGYSLRRQIGKRNFSAFLSQTVTYPERSNIGFELEPKPYETVNFSLYAQNGVTSLITNQTPGAPFALSSTRRLTSVQPLGNRSGFSLNFNRRF